LEKIEMKKTLVAIAAFAAVTGAMAEVKISGTVDYSFMKTETGAITTNTMGGDTNQFNNLMFSASEDLGNGMTASAAIDLGIGYDYPTEDGGAAFTRSSHVGLSGEFGDFKIGRQLPPIFLAATIDPVGLPALSVGQEGLNTIFLIGGARNVRYNGSASYTSPAISGFKFNYFTAQANSQAVATVGATTGYGLAYATGPISLEYQTQKTDNEGIALYHRDAIAGGNAAGYEAGGDQTSRALFAAKYDAGFATLAYIRGTTSHATLGTTSNYVAIGVPVTGTNFKISAAINRSTVDDKNADANSAAVNGSIVKVNYGFSKRTNAYFIYGNDETNNVNGADTSRKTTTTSFGLSHSF
jgi:predicted porin